MGWFKKKLEKMKILEEKKTNGNGNGNVDI
jgi:hypothetical protein